MAVHLGAARWDDDQIGLTCAIEPVLAGQRPAHCGANRPAIDSDDRKVVAGHAFVGAIEAEPLAGDSQFERLDTGEGDRYD